MLYALPGMGADRRMYPTPWHTLPDFVVLEWPRYTGEETLADAARTVCVRAEIKDGDSLVGSSLGGMVACEIAKIRHIETVFLIGSATNKGEINRWLSPLLPLAAVTPFTWIQFSARRIATPVAQMFTTVDAKFMRAMCSAIRKWDGLAQTDSKIVRIHGKRDHLITAPANPDLLLDGGHLISMTHATECVEFIRKLHACA